MPETSTTRMAQGACAGRRAHRLRSVAAHSRLGEEGEGSARQPRRRAGRRRTQSDRRGLEGPARGVEGASRRPARPICRQVGGGEAHRDRRLAGQATCRCGGAIRAGFDRLGVQHPRRGRDPHAGRAGLCAGPRRRHRRSVRRRARRSAPTSASISATVSGCTSAPSSKARWPNSRARPWSSIRSGRSPPFSKRSSKRRRQGRADARPDHPSQGDQESGGDRRPEGRAGARRRGPSRASSAGSTRRRRRATSTSLRRPTISKRCAARIGELRDLSFDSISGAGPNGAIVHYRSSEKTNRKLEQGTLYLIDSGGQYVDGTTDITRTVPIGEPTAEMRDRFTRVLKGHIAIATAVFPKGTRGSQLDSFARRPLWEAGLDYAHGTGHGVGSFLVRPRRAAAHFARGQLAERRRRAAAGGHDPLERARLLQDRRVRHPDRESRAGRRSARSRARRRKCSGSRR